MTPFSPSMKGTVKPSQLSSKRFTLPLRPKTSCMATAPTKGGMMRGITPRLWMRVAPPSSSRVVK